MKHHVVVLATRARPRYRHAVCKDAAPADMTAVVTFLERACADSVPNVRLAAVCALEAAATFAADDLVKMTIRPVLAEWPHVAVTVERFRDEILIWHVTSTGPCSRTCARTTRTSTRRSSRRAPTSRSAEGGREKDRPRRTEGVRQARLRGETAPGARYRAARTAVAAGRAPRAASRVASRSPRITQSGGARRERGGRPETAMAASGPRARCS